jgi:hypothetical protein
VRIESILRIGKCLCESVHCHRQRFHLSDDLVFLTRELQSSHVSCIDDQLQFDLLCFMKKVVIYPEAPLLLIHPSQIENKCVLFPINDDFYCVPIDNVLEGN